MSFLLSRDLPGVGTLVFDLPTRARAVKQQARNSKVRLAHGTRWTAVLILSLATMQGGGRPYLHGHVQDSHVQAAIAASTAVRQMARLDRLTLAIGLPLRNQDELNTLLNQLFDPHSPNFHRYLTPAQFAERFGPTESDYQAIASLMEAKGLTITGTHPNRMILDVGGTAAAIESAFHVNMMCWRHPTRGEFFGPDREPTLDVSMPVLDISGLDNFAVPHPMDLKARRLESRFLATAKPLYSGTGPIGLFDGTDFRNAYAPAVTLTGAGQSVGLLEFDGFYANDVTSNFDEIGLPYVPVKTVLVDGFSGAPGQENVEVTLDIMMAAYMAPGLTNVIVYEGTNPEDVLNRMATDNLASQLSSSWGWGPIGDTTLQIFTEMVAQGQAFFQASGDSGAYLDGVMPPADVPNLTTVGGTVLITAGPGGAWQSESTWSGSGGGVSTFFTIPSYQQTVNMVAAGGSATMRNIPDVAMLSVQIFLFANNGQGLEIGGTSASAPLWAGFMALANQQATINGTPPVGFVNPSLYAIGAGASYQSDLHDVVTGDNGGFTALSGYDLATGWGSPTGQPLINTLTGSTGPQSFSLTSSASTVGIIAGTSSTSTITISAQNGFSDSVSLAASGLPEGVTALFSPATTTTTSTLTLTANSSAASSTATITITGTSARLTNTVQLLLTVTGLPAFTLVTSPETMSLAQGASGTRTVSITPQNGFTGTVALAATGLPAGVTASFTPASTTKTSKLKLSVASAATLCTSTVTITGTSGSLSSTASVSLTVAAPPSFALTSSPTSLTVVQGATGVSTITVASSNGFSGNVAFSASGLPTGVTALFSAAATTKPGTLTLTASASASVGTSSITITGTSGSLSSNAAVSLTVAAPPSFALTASPTSLTVVQGATGVSTITVAPSNGFSGNVVLTASGLPTGVTALFSTATTTKPGTLTLTASASASVGTSSITITGTSGSLSSTASVSLTVAAPPSFALTSSPTSLTVVQGATGVSTITVASSNGFSGNVTFSASGLPTGVTALFSAAATTKPGTLTLTASASASVGTSSITITGTSGSLSSNAAVSLTVAAPPSFALTASPTSLTVVQGATGVSTITVAPSNGFSGNVAFSASGLPTGVTALLSTATTTKPGTLTLTASASATLGTSSVTITGTSGSLSGTATLSLTVAAPPSFALTASPTSLTVVQGATGVSTITIASLNGFNGAVAFSASGLPSGVTMTFSSSGALSSTATVRATANASTGPAAVTITGTSGSLSAKVTIALTLLPQPTFTLAAMPTNLNITPGASGASSIIITNLSGFNGKVALAMSDLPKGVTAAFSAVNSGSSTLALTAAVTAAGGTSNVTITGTLGPLSSKATIALTIIPPPSFTLSATPASLSVTRGSSGASSIAITDSSGFTGAVTLSASGLLKGVTATFSAVTSGKSAVKFAAASSAAGGTSTVTITGKSGSLTETTIIALTVVSGPT